MKSRREQILHGRVDALSHDGRGIVRVEGKVFFIDYALPGDLITFQRGRKRRSYETGRILELLEPAVERVAPGCQYFGVCGGCALQHLAPAAQIAAKQQQLSDNLERISKVRPERWLDPLCGNDFGYRRKARLGVRYVPKKGGILVGFRERSKSYITSLQQCPVLDPLASTLLPGLHTLISSLSCYERVPQVEVAVADNATALVFRHLVELSVDDFSALRAYADQNRVQVWLQPGGLDSVYPLQPEHPEPLYYTLGEYQLQMFFEATDFIQVNADVNQRLINHTLSQLELGPNEEVLDLFCGLGNFSLPAARRARRVTGVEGAPGLVQRATDNALHNGVDNAEFLTTDLYADDMSAEWLRRRYDKVLLDPPRTGAIEVIKHIPWWRPQRVVYVSCNPATLARDAEMMVHKHGFRLAAAGVVNMFPHTTHVESVAVFEQR